MRLIFSILSSVAGFYIILIFIRFIISWFSTTVNSKPVEILCRITDPYIDWWRKVINLRLGFLDLSPIVGIAALSVIRTILYTISHYERIGIGIIMGIVLMALWSVASFILGFCVIVLVLRIFAFLANRDIYTPFWKIIESITQPLLYKTNGIIFGNRMVSYLKGIIITTLILTAIWIGGGFIMPMLANLLFKLPL